MAKRYDAIIIGTGQAGPPLASRLSAAGRTLAVVERKRFGGTCVNTGCIPTKTLVASAYAMHKARQGELFGFSGGAPVRADMKRVKQRKDEISGKSSKGVESSLRSLANCTVYREHARFLSAHEVQVGAEVLQGDQIFINVGGRATRPAIAGLEDVPYLTNSSMMDVDFLPEHLLIVGGSYIALEFAQMYRRFGSRVTIMERGSRLLSREDEDVSKVAKEILEKEDIEVRLDAECIRIEKNGSAIVAGLEGKSGQHSIAGSHLLVATGRRPNTDELGLDAAGISTDAHGYIQVNDRLETNVPGVFALGDCNGRGAFTHTSYNDFEIVAANLLDEGSRSVSDRITAYAVYTDPPLGRAGMTLAEARRTGKRLLLGERPMTRIARAVEKGEPDGFVRIIVDADSQRIIGASIFGTGGDEVIHCILDTMYAGVPYTTLQRAVHIHPTVSELIPTILGELKPAT